jgi:biopolymer transport protein ExbD
MAKKKRRLKRGEIPTSSMADIAFLLLIFFLVTTTIDIDKGLGIVLPAEGQELEIRKENILNLLVNSMGQVLLGEEPIKMEDVHRVIRERLQANDRLIISVKTHGKTKYRDFIAAIDQLIMANATRISIAETD